jgi:hypothetical protein
MSGVSVRRCAYMRSFERDKTRMSNERAGCDHFPRSGRQPAAAGKASKPRSASSRYLSASSLDRPSPKNQPVSLKTSEPGLHETRICRRRRQNLPMPFEQPTHFQRSTHIKDFKHLIRISHHLLSGFLSASRSSMIGLLSRSL